MSIHPAVSQRSALVRDASTIPFPIAEFIASVPGACGGCRSWAELAGWADRVGLYSRESDPLLRWLLRGIRDRPQQFQDGLLLVVWSFIARLSGRLRRLDRDEWALWTQLTSTFLQVAPGLDLDARSELVGKKLLNDTQRNVRRQYAQERYRPRRVRELPDFTPLDDDEDALDEWGAPDPAFEGVDLQHDGDWCREHLKHLVRQGSLTQTDYLLLIGRCLYGRSLGDMAARRGLNYEAAKKRLQRVERFLQKRANKMSPDRVEHGLYPVEGPITKRRRHG